MSADRWSVCPRCKDRNDAKLVAEAKALEDSYGKISAPEWMAANAEWIARNEAAETPKSTFREDYEILDIDDGTVSLRYHGQCGECGLTAKVEHTERFYLPEQA